jgi:hypothetical protein
MANASKQKFKEIKKKLKADIALGIHQLLNKISKTAGDKAKKQTNAAAAKIVKDFIKKLKKEEKSVKSTAKRKPAKKTKATSAPKKKPAAKKRVVRKPAVKKESAEIVATTAPMEETSHEHQS